MHRIEELTAAVKELTAALLVRNQPVAHTPSVTAAEVIAERDATNATMKDAKKSAQAKKDAASVADTVASVTEVTEVPKPTTPIAATEPVATQPIAEAPAAQEPKAEVSAATYEDVRAAFMALNTSKGREATVAVLKALGAERVPDIKKADFAKAVELAKAA